MGLSDQERLSGIAFSIGRFHELMVNAKEHDFHNRQYAHHKAEKQKLYDLIDKLWHTYLKRNCGRIGATTAYTIEDVMGDVWTVAIENHTSNCKQNENQYRHEFDPFNGFLDIKGLLNSEYKRFVFGVYQETENLLYYLRRYDDEFLELHKLISDIQGQCFESFSKDEDYAKAYVLNQVLKIVYGHNEQDVVYKFLTDENWHHNFSINHVKLGDLMATHIELEMAKLEKTKSLTEKSWDLVRLVAGANLLKPSAFQYDHTNKILMEFVSICAENTKQIEQFKQLIEAKKKQYQEQKKQEQERYSKTDPTGIYPYDMTGEFRSKFYNYDKVKEEIAPKLTKQKTSKKKG